MKIIWRIILLFLPIPLVCPAQNLLNAPQEIVIDKKPGRVGYTRNRVTAGVYFVRLRGEVLNYAQKLVLTL